MLSGCWLLGTQEYLVHGSIISPSRQSLAVSSLPWVMRVRWTCPNQEISLVTILHVAPRATVDHGAFPVDLSFCTSGIDQRTRSKLGEKLRERRNLPKLKQQSGLLRGLWSIRGRCNRKPCGALFCFTQTPYCTLIHHVHPSLVSVHLDCSNISRRSLNRQPACRRRRSRTPGSRG